MLNLAKIKLDTRKLDAGSWWAITADERGNISGDHLPGEPGDRPALLIVPIGIGYHRALGEEQEPHLTALRDDKLPDVRHEEIVAGIEGRALARKVLRGWANLGFGNGEEKWTEERAVELLSMREWKTLREFVLTASGVRSAAAAKEEAQALGN